MEKVSVVCILSSYIVAIIFAVMRLKTPARWNRVLTLAMTAAGFYANTVYLMVRARNADLPPLLASTHDWLLVLAWVAVLLLLFLSWLDPELPLGVFVLPLVLVLVVTSQIVGIEVDPRARAEELNQLAQRGWLILHTSLLVFGIVGVLGSLVLSLMYLAQHRRLKHGETMQEGLHLPSLARLARWNRWAVVVSVPTLTVGMAAGVLLGVISRKAGGAIVFTDPIVIASGIGWSVMVALFVWLVSTRRPAARQVAMLTVWACGFLLVTIVGLQMVTGTGHRKLPAASVNEPLAT